MPYYARSANATGQKQLLKDHLQQVGELAEKFATEAGLPTDMGRWAGLLHDLGKYSDEFQRHLERGDRDMVEHACHGAAIAASANAVEIAFAVAAHHGGLGTKGDIGEFLKNRPERTATLSGTHGVLDRARSFVAIANEADNLAFAPVGTPVARNAEIATELRTRMLLSCLADADRLNAQDWGTPEETAQRSVTPLDARAGIASLEDYLSERRAEPRGTVKVNAIRDRVFAAAMAAGPESPGFFSLTVPTGGGKTLASLAFALRHAQEHGLRRVIFVLPFLAIIEQNAEVIQDAVGNQFVLEHHSGETARKHDRDEQELAAVQRRLLAENWDAPIVVTTTVQFFESLFSDHPTALRKVHNIPGSVVIFDEAQTFPPGVLRPLVGMLKQLKDDYRCSFVFCTATQPAFSKDIRGVAPLIPPADIREIAPDPAALFAALKRVHVAWPTAGSTTTMAEVAAEMATAPDRQALAIVNTKKQAASLYRELLKLDADAVHLSTRLCSAHRKVIFSGLRDRLVRNEPCLVAATQLIEAGVDVDFPAVWRAFGPLDSIAQAAGRCNREGNRDIGSVTVFRPEDGTLPGDTYRKATSTTQTMLDYHGGIDIHNPEVYGEYFQRFYNVNDLDAKRVDDSRRAFHFPDVARDFAIIDSPTTPVLVSYADEGRRWIRRVKTATTDHPVLRGERRAMQRYSVALYPHELQAAIAAGAVRLVESCEIFVTTPVATYDAKLGLILPNDPLQD